MTDSNTQADEYKAAYDRADKEVKQALEERDALDKKILYLKQTKATLMRLMGMMVPTAIINKGITEAVRDYLRWAKAHHPKQPVSIREIREQLESIGYDFSSHKNPNASVSGTLERMYEA